MVALVLFGGGDLFFVFFVWMGRGQEPFLSCVFKGKPRESQQFVGSVFSWVNFWFGLEGKPWRKPIAFGGSPKKRHTNVDIDLHHMNVYIQNTHNDSGRPGGPIPLGRGGSMQHGTRDCIYIYKLYVYIYIYIYCTGFPFFVGYPEVDLSPGVVDFP